MMGWKFRVSVVLLLVAAAAVWFSRAGGEGEPDEPTALATWQAPEQCRPCHENVWRDWESSLHRRSFTDMPVQAAFRHFGFDRKCQSCHAAEPIFVTGLDAEPLLRTEDPESGVHCLTCHLAADGHSVAALRDLPGAPCRPVARPELAGPLCGACHTAIAADWLAWRKQSAGQSKSCIDCHGTGNGHSSHGFPGAHRESMVRAAARLECREDQGDLVVTVHNQGAGHNFPGERHNRVLLLEVIQRDVEGEISSARQHLIKGITPFRGETSADQIRAGESVACRFPLLGAPATAEVRLLYKSFPWISDLDALVVHQERRVLSSGGKKP